MFVLSSVMMLVALFALAQAAIKANARTKTDKFLGFSAVMAEVYNIVETKYVEEVDRDKLFQAAIHGMFLALDDHSQYLSADSYAQLNKETEGSFSGIGIHIGMRNGLLTVIAPIPGSPAARLGVMPWDRIIKVNGEDTKGIQLQDAVNKLTGIPGTTVDVTIYRPGENRTIDLTIARANVKVNSVYSQVIGDDIGYARVTKFANDASGDLKRALLGFHRSGAQGVILDLRFNTGGLLNEAIAVSDLFLKKGLDVVSTRGRQATQTKIYKSEHEPVTRLPVIVLVNNGSASASEIVAAALRDNDRGLLLGPKGQRTYGKWSVQTIEELRHSLAYDEEGNPRASAMRLTTARYYGPKGETFQGDGIPFDEELELPQTHEQDLFMKGGLLGDPNMVEPDETIVDHFPTDEEVKNGGALLKSVLEDTASSATTAADDTSTTTTVEVDDGPVIDLLLEHATKMLRSHIQLGSRKAA